MPREPHNSAPTTSRLGNQYTSIAALRFEPSAPQQSGKAVPIPNTNNGNIAQGVFHKINTTLMPKPLAKIVIGTQMNRL
jgi:hypothetical protein